MSKFIYKIYICIVPFIYTDAENETDIKGNFRLFAAYKKHEMENGSLFSLVGK
jgi:hypothetical protein